ncbi:hypothetical protein [Jeongeupia naejangsanensis]|uniref:Uncharacterized protein n=1 Tax=Jeongeupia naejangsanensis TaxID=613195 RepID=A0ABS2BHW6_9NEIS|nr:hypothetical protein [Jeongeupia naejangsanensis]MBM3115197.1 hypothetical protein [Jeongeupia naejangsanensis]
MARMLRRPMLLAMRIARSFVSTCSLSENAGTALQRCSGFGNPSDSKVRQYRLNTPFADGESGSADECILAAALLRPHPTAPCKRGFSVTACPGDCSTLLSYRLKNAAVAELRLHAQRLFCGYLRWDRGRASAQYHFAVSLLTRRCVVDCEAPIEATKGKQARPTQPGIKEDWLFVLRWYVWCAQGRPVKPFAQRSPDIDQQHGPCADTSRRPRERGPSALPVLHNPGIVVRGHRRCSTNGDYSRIELFGAKYGKDADIAAHDATVEAW